MEWKTEKGGVIILTIMLLGLTYLGYANEVLSFSNLPLLCDILGYYLQLALEPEVCKNNNFC